MISGAFNLNNQNNGDYKKFYSKSIYKIFAPVLLAIMLFFIFDLLNIIENNAGIIVILKIIAKGGYYNLWFMYMLFGLYMITPFIVKLKSLISFNEFKIVAIAMMLWAVISQATSSQKTAYSIGVVFAFLGYYMMGNVLINSKININKYISLVCFVALVAITYFVRKIGFSYYLFNAYTNFFSPTIVVLSLITFLFFKNLKINTSYASVASYTFYFYLFHSITYKTCFALFEKHIPLWRNAHELCKIIVLLIITVLISGLLSYFYNLLWLQLDKKGLKNKWLNMSIWKKE